MDNDLKYNFIPFPEKDEIICIEKQDGKKESILKSHSHLKLSKLGEAGLMSGEIKYSLQILDAINLDKSWETLQILSGAEIKSCVQKNLQILSYSKVKNLEVNQKNEKLKVAIEKILKEFKSLEIKDISESVFGFIEGKDAYKGRLKFHALNLSENKDQIKWIEKDKEHSEPKTLNENNYLIENRLRGSKFYQLIEVTNKDNADNTDKKIEGRIEFKNLSNIELGLLISSIKPFKDSREYIGLEYESRIGQGILTVEAVYIEDFERFSERLNTFKSSINSTKIQVPPKNNWLLTSEEIDKLRVDFEFFVDEKLNKNKEFKLFDYKNNRMNAFYYSKTRTHGKEGRIKTGSVEELMKAEIEAYKKLQETLNKTNNINIDRKFDSFDEEVEQSYSVLLVSDKDESGEAINILCEFKNVTEVTLDEVFNVYSNNISTYDLVVFNNYGKENDQLKMRNIINGNLKTGFIYYNDKNERFNKAIDNKFFNFANSYVTLRAAVMSVAKYIDIYRKKGGSDNE